MSLGKGIKEVDNNRLYEADGLHICDFYFWRFHKTGNVYRVEENMSEGYIEREFFYLGNAGGDREFVAIVDECILEYVSKLTTAPRKILEGHYTRRW